MTELANGIAINPTTRERKEPKRLFLFAIFLVWFSFHISKQCVEEEK